MTRSSTASARPCSSTTAASPTARPRRTTDDIYVLALRNIAAGEELTYEYHLYDSDDDDQPCFCGTESCRGTMFSTKEVKRRKKLGLPLTLRKRRPSSKRS